MFSKPYDTAPVINATLTVPTTSVTSSPGATSLEQQLLDQGYSYVITKQSTSGFTIQLNKSAAADVQFSWSALSITNPKSSQSGSIAVPSLTPSVTPESQ